MHILIFFFFFKSFFWLQVDETTDLGVEREPVKGAAKVSVPLSRVVIHYQHTVFDCISFPS